MSIITRISLYVDNSATDGIYRAPKMMSVLEDTDRKREKDERRAEKKRSKIRQSNVVSVSLVPSSSSMLTAHRPFSDPISRNAYIIQMIIMMVMQ
jgi:hypothetical protein